MIQSLIIAIGGIVALMILWIVVQSFWRKTFIDHISDEDVLVGRTSCSNCGCTTICEIKRKEISSKEKIKSI